jgi:flagella basal body P-ring formation protein FlgA
MRIYALTLLVFLPLGQLTHAQTDLIQPLDQIEKAVSTFVLEEQASQDNVSVEVRPLDKRLRLSRCEGGLQTQWSAGSRTLGRVTVQVSCAEPISWRVHVQATVLLEGYVWTLERGAQRGDVLSKSILAKRKIMLGANNAALTALGNPIVDVEPWLGYTFSQRISAGKVLTDRMLKRANLVTKGEKVLIRHQATGLQLQTFGTALKSAASDQRIQVRNNSSGKIIEVVVVARGLVEVIH